MPGACEYRADDGREPRVHGLSSLRCGRVQPLG